MFVPFTCAADMTRSLMASEAAPRVDRRPCPVKEVPRPQSGSGGDTERSAPLGKMSTWVADMSPTGRCRALPHDDRLASDGRNALTQQQPPWSALSQGVGPTTAYSTVRGWLRGETRSGAMRVAIAP